MADMNPSYRVLEKRINTLIPLGLSNVWVKVKGDNAFNLGRLLGFTPTEWDRLMNMTGLIVENRISSKKWKGLVGLVVENERYDTTEIVEQSKWYKFSFADEWVSHEFI